MKKEKNFSDGWYLIPILCPYVFVHYALCVLTNAGVQQGCLCCRGCSQGQRKREAIVFKRALHSLVLCILWGGYQLMCVLASFPASTNRAWSWN